MLFFGYMISLSSAGVTLWAELFMLVCERDLQAYFKVFLVGKISISLLWLLSLFFFLICYLSFVFLTMFYCSSFRAFFNWVRTVI